MRWTVGASVVLLAAAPAPSVKAGVDAWSRGDYPAAVAAWRGPAVAGDADAEFNMGQAYKLGRGVPADLPQAEEWFRKAAVQGHPQAGDNYGLTLFQDGRRADALPWLEKSVARDERRAELVLGTMLFNGDGVPKDWPRAYALVTRSQAQGLQQAGQTLAQMDGFLSPEQRQQGVQMAAEIASGAKTASPTVPKAPRREVASILPTPPRHEVTGVEPTDLPPSTATGATYAPPESGDAPPAPRHVTAKPAAPKPALQPRPAPKVAAAPKPAPAATGRFHVQLGAFRDEGNAHALWSRVGAKVGGRPSFTKANGLTRLTAGPFATRAEAERACKAAGGGCEVVS